MSLLSVVVAVVLSRYISCWPVMVALEIILAVLVLASVLVVLVAMTVNGNCDVRYR
jgi:hypothetical protein